MSVGFSVEGVTERVFSRSPGSHKDKLTVEPLHCIPVAVVALLSGGGGVRKLAASSTAGIPCLLHILGNVCIRSGHEGVGTARETVSLHETLVKEDQKVVRKRYLGPRTV